MEKLPPAIEIVPDRSSVELFSATRYCTSPSPDPLAPAVTVIHEL
jgi:hypothetical protein